MAYTAGTHYFRCPLCNNTRKFRAAMKECGILIPDRDAAWENNNAYLELLERYNQCDANNCKNPQGRTVSYVDGAFQLILCEFCGSSGIHAVCGDLEGDNPSWQCSVCLPKPKASPRGKHKMKKRSSLGGPNRSRLSK